MGGGIERHNQLSRGQMECDIEERENKGCFLLGQLDLQEEGTEGG